MQLHTVSRVVRRLNYYYWIDVLIVERGSGMKRRMNRIDELVSFEISL